MSDCCGPKISGGGAGSGGGALVNNGTFAVQNDAAKSSNFNVDASKKGNVYPVDISSGNVSGALPASAGLTAGFKVTFEIITAAAGNTFTAVPNGADTITGPSTETQVGASLTLEYAGSATWYAVVEVLGQTAAQKRATLGASSAGVWPLSVGGVGATNALAAKQVLQTPYDGASFSTGVVSPSLLNADGNVFIFDTSGGAGTLNLPAATSGLVGVIPAIKNETGALNVTINAAAGDTVDGAASLVLTPGQGVTLQLADTTAGAGKWVIVASVSTATGSIGGTVSGNNIIPIATALDTIGDGDFINNASGGMQNGSGGNARGTAAIDFQNTRGAANQVASGNRAFIGAGQNNRVAGNDSATIGGDGGTVTVARSVILGGTNDLCSAVDSVALAGDGNQASAQKSVVGGWDALADKYGEWVVGHQSFDEVGDAQSADFFYQGSTADATPTELSLMNAGSYLTLNEGDAYAIEAEVVALASGVGGNAAMWESAELRGLITRAAGTTTWYGTGNAAPGASAGGSLAGAFVQLAADDTNDRLSVTVTGIAATSIRWVIRLRVVKVNYN